MRRVGGVIHVLDRYHLEKYLTKLTVPFGEDAKGIRSELYRIICKGTKADFARKVWEFADMLPETANRDAFDESANYILANWTAAKLRLTKVRGRVGSSTEGHVSHVLASRMTKQRNEQTRGNREIS